MIWGLPGDGGHAVRTPDAVVVVPGIMGSELRDRETDRMIWGLKDPRWYGRSWKQGGLAPLALTPAENDALADGKYDPQTARIVPGRTLRVPASLPVLRGAEPYTDLITDLRRITLASEAVLEFGYDWRLPVSFNARLLRTTIREHLAAWRAHPAYTTALHGGTITRPAQVVIVAHSMGGLLAQHLSLLEAGTDSVRLTITLGTPFHGAVKAAELLNAGRGAPMPIRRADLRAVTATMPGVHDLLPGYRCLLSDGLDGVPDVTRPTVNHLAALGADPDLATRADADRQARARVTPPGHTAIIGTEQATTQSMTVQDGVVHTAQRSYDWDDHGELRRDTVGQPLWTDERGDGTVFRYAATPPGTAPFPMVQSHGGLARGSEVLGAVRGLILDRPWRGIPLGEGHLGLEVPDAAVVGDTFEIVVTGEDDPGLVDVRLDRIDPDQDVRLSAPLVGRSAGREGLRADLRLVEPGLYRVSVATGGSNPVTQLVLCEEPDD